ncbi:MAG: hypothetical protein SW833_25105 [Cyanobacteriota bacterium]|nr:hypothetical protein [Cyanobacteriota bacterium]
MIKQHQYKQLAVVLEEQCDLQWEISKIRGTDKLDNWTPIVEDSENEICLGIAKSGYWVSTRGKFIVPLLENNILRDLLPYFKKTRSKTTLLLRKSLEERGFPGGIEQSFPIDTLISSGLKFESDYWAGLALNWIEGMTVNEEIQIELQKVVVAKWASQKTRHRARKLLVSAKRT